MIFPAIPTVAVDQVPVLMPGGGVALLTPSFLTPLDLEYIDGVTWRITAPFDYASVVLERVLVIPAGTETDFASTPRWTWPVLPPTGIYGKAAAVHDYLYRTLGLATKDQADRVFLEAMTVLGVPRWKRQAMYRAVCWFGASSYKGGL